jgi:putative ABC transport system permease protein
LGVTAGFSGQWFQESGGRIAELISGIGGFVMCIGFLFVIPQLFSWIVALIAKPMRRLFEIESTIAARNVIRYRRRAGFAVMTLALGITIALSAQIFLSSGLSAMERSLRKQFPADLVVRVPYSAVEAYLTTEASSEILKIQGIEKMARVATHVEVKLKDFDFKKSDPKWLNWVDRPNDFFEKDDVEIYPADTVALKEILSLTVAQGEPLEEELKSGEAFMTEEAAKQLGMKVGDVLTVTSPKGRQHLKIVSIIKNYPLLRGVPYLFVNLEWGMDIFGTKGYETLHIKVSPTVSIDKIEPKIRTILQDQPNAEYINYQNVIMEQQKLFSQQMFLIKALILIVFLISGIGLMNAIVSSLHDRRHETGVIQAMGATPRQMLRIVGLEGMFMGIGGGLIGIVGGGILAHFILRATEIKTIAFPWGTIAILSGVSILLGVLASTFAMIQVRRLPLSDVLKIE